MKSMNAPAVFHYFETNDKLARSRIESLFEGKTIHLDNRYSVRIDSPRHSKMQQNFHVQHKGSDICIINKDGTMSHRSSSDKLPAYVKDMLRSRRFFLERTLLYSCEKEQLQDGIWSQKIAY